MEISKDGKMVSTGLGRILPKNISLLDIHNISFQVNSIVSFDNDSFSFEAYNYTVENTKCEPCKIAVLSWTRLYAKYHGYVSIIICVFGTIANIFNIIVLTKKELACAPINRILTGLAVADMLLMIDPLLQSLTTFAPFLLWLFHSTFVDKKKNFPTVL